MAAGCNKLALLPFENLSGLSEDARLVAGLVQDLITELARFPTLGVIAAQSSFAAAAAELDDAGIGRRLEADFLVKGSVRRSSGALRINVHLLESASGRHLWAERYDVPVEDLFQVQDEIIARIANSLAGRMDHTALAASRMRNLTSLAVYECWLRGMETIQTGTCEADAVARQYFAKASELDPRYARAMAGLSLSHFNEWSCEAWHKWEENERLAYDYARQAEALDPNDQLVQVILGRIEQYRRRFDSAATRFERALHLAPNDASTLIQLAACFTYNGYPERGEEVARRALALHPLCPGWYYTYASLPLFVLKRYDEAAQMAGKGPGLVDTAAYQAASYAYAGNHERAAFFLREFQEVFRHRITSGQEPQPGEAVSWLRHVNPYRHDLHMAHFIEGVRLAGLDAPPASPRPAAPLSWPLGNIFRKEGGLWTICFDREAVQIPEVRGFHDLAHLLAEPGTEVHCLTLAGQPGEMPTGRGTEMLDDQARRAYQRRLQEIDEELAEVSSAHDPVRATRLEQEREALVEEVKRAIGLGGKVRKMGDPAERARSAVTWRIRHAIKKLEAAHPALARHLSNSLRTGVYCAYIPEKDTRWQV